MRESVREQAREVVKTLSMDKVYDDSKVIEDYVFEFLGSRFDLSSSDTKIFVYNSYGKEVYTHSIIERLIDMGASVYLPIVRGNVMLPVLVDKDTEYVVGDYGIKEPVGKIYDGEFDISITPLLAYDRALNRMGKGKGYYDRFFAGHIVKCIIGLAFKAQEVDSTCPEPHDFKVDAVITEEGIICE